MTLDLPPVTDPLDSLDPQVAEFVRRSIEAGKGYPARESLTPQQARDLAVETRRQWFEGGPVMARTEESTVPTRHGPLRMRIHRPEGVETKAAFLYLPGGGWTLFSIETHDRLMREYAEAGKMVVIGIDYTRSPEAKFPQAIEELDDVVDWLLANGDSIGIDPARIAMGGDSAGANMTTGLAIKRRDEGKPQIAAMVLNYGSYDMGLIKGSVMKYGSGAYLLSTHMMLWFSMQYINSPEDMLHPWASPLRSPSLKGLPQAYMVITDHDVLFDDNMRFAREFAEAGGDVTPVIYPGTVHSFLEAMSIAEVSRRAIRETVAWIRERLG